MILIFCGIDKSGKTTLIKAFHERTNYRYPCIDRFTPTSYAYGQLRNRDLNYNEYFLEDLKLINNTIIFYLECSDKTLKERFKKTKETDISINDVFELSRNYREYLISTPLKVVFINTELSIEKNINRIVREISIFKNEAIYHKITKIRNLIVKLGTEVRNTKELNNIHLTYTKENLSDLHVYLQENNLYHSEEQYEYDEILFTLKNTINLILNYHKTDTIESRRFIYTSNSCISFIQLLYRKSVLKVYITIRSSNIELLLMDIYSLYRISESLNDLFFHANAITYYLTINSAHAYIIPKKSK